MPTDKFGNLITDAESIKSQAQTVKEKAYDQTTSYESLEARGKQAAEDILNIGSSSAVTDEFGNRYFRNVAVAGNMSPFAEIAKGAKSLGSQIDNGVQLFVLNLKFAKAQLIFAKGLVDPLVILLQAAADALIDALNDLLNVGFYHIYIWPWEHGEKIDDFDFNLDQAFWYMYMISQGAPIGLDEREYLDSGETAFDPATGIFFTADRDNVKNPYFMKVLDDFNFSSYPELEEKMAEHTINVYQKTPYSIKGDEARAYYNKSVQEAGVDVDAQTVMLRKAKLEQWAGNAGNYIAPGMSPDDPAAASFSLENFMNIMSRDPAVMIEKHVPAMWGLKTSASSTDKENVKQASLLTMDGKASNFLRSLDKIVIPGLERLTPAQILSKLAASIDDTADPNRPVGTGKFSAVVFLLALPNPSSFNETLELVYSFFGGGLIGGKIKKGIDYFKSNSDVGKTLKIKLHAAAEDDTGIQWLGVEGLTEDEWKKRDFASLRVPDFVKKKTNRWVKKKNKWQKAWYTPRAGLIHDGYSGTQTLPEPHLVFPYFTTNRDPDSWFGRYTGDKVCQGDVVPWFEADVVSHSLYKNEASYKSALAFEEKGEYAKAQDEEEDWKEVDSVEKYKKFMAAGGLNILTVSNMSGNLKLGGKAPIRPVDPYNDLGGSTADLSPRQLKYAKDREEFTASGGEFGDAASRRTYEAGKIPMKEFELKTYEQAWFVNEMTEVENKKAVVTGTPPNWSDKILIQTIFPPYGEAIQRCINFVQQAKGLLENPFQFIDDMIKYLNDLIKEVIKLNKQIQRILKIIADGLPATGLYQLVLIDEEGGAEGFQNIIRNAKFFDFKGEPFNGTGDPSGLDGLEYSMAICFYGQGPDSAYIQEFQKMLGLARSQAREIQKATARALQPGVALNLEQPEITKTLIGAVSVEEDSDKNRTDREFWGGWSQILASGADVNGAEGIEATSIIFIEFSEPMDHGSIQKAVSVYRPPIRSTGNITDVPGNLFVALNDNERMFIWVPTVKFEEEMNTVFKFDPNDVPLLNIEVAKAQGKDINGTDVAYEVPVEDVSFTAANPAVITRSSHGFSTSDKITITKSPEASALEVRTEKYSITKIDDDSFSIAVDASNENAATLSYTFTSTYAAQNLSTPDDLIGESPDDNFDGLTQSVHSIADVLKNPHFKSIHAMLSSDERKEASTHFFRVDDFTVINIQDKLRDEGETIVVRNPKSNDLTVGVTITEYGKNEADVQTDADTVYGTAIITEILLIGNTKQYVFLDGPISGFAGIGHKLSDGTTMGACVRITNQNYRLKISTEAKDQNENRLGVLNQFAQPNNIEDDYVTETGFTIRTLTGI